MRRFSAPTFSTRAASAVVCITARFPGPMNGVRRQPSVALSASSRFLSATLAGMGLDLGVFRRAHETTSVQAASAAAGHEHESSSAAASSSSTIKTGVDARSSPIAKAPETMSGQPCVVRGRLERARGHGKIAFLHLRQPPGESVQVVCLGKAIAAQARAIPPESVIEVTGEMRRAEKAPIHSTTCAHHELHAQVIRIVSTAAVPLPFPLQDARTKLDTRLNNRAMDLRTRLSSSVVRIVSAVCRSYRNALLELSFVEVHTPKLVAAASEGGSAVFPVKYFEASRAFLAQSPQLYKQMCINGDVMRVFEVGPVFRAEKSLTHRHLTEFTGLDAEMVIQDSYTEVLDVLEHVMCRVIGDLQDEGKPYADLVRAATAALQEQAEAEADTEKGDSAPAATRAQMIAPSVSDIVCEVSEAMVSTLGLGCDSDVAAATTAAADPYKARIGGGQLSLVSSDSNAWTKCPRVLRMAFDDAVRMLRDAGAVENDAAIEDFSLPQERRLGELVKARYGVDLYVVDRWPMSARPFYTMPCDDAGDDTGASPVASGYAGRTRSYDMYLRGEEICSGAQRQHDVTQLTQRLAEMGISLTDSSGCGLRDYVDSFRYGAWPHGGFGLGLERIVSFFLNARDIRQISLFPRDPKRLTP